MKNKHLAIISLLLSSQVFAYGAAKAAPSYTQTELIASCLYLEAGGEGLRGVELVACVIQNRMRADGETAAQVITKPKQFSCFNKGIVIKYDSLAYSLARRVEQKGIQDFTGGAYFYQRNELPRRKWHGDKVLTYKNHTFYLKK